MNSYASMCSLLGRPFFPPLEDTVLLWGSSFGAGRTYRNYIGHLKKACLLADCTLSWYSPSVKEIARGLRFAKRSPFTFPNFIYTQDLYRIINPLGWAEIFTQLVFPSFLFSLGIPSEALPMRRARPSGRISEFVPQDGRVPIGVRCCAGAECLVIKMSQRKNLSGGCILKRLFLCGDASHQARKIWPPPPPPPDLASGP